MGYYILGNMVIMIIREDLMFMNLGLFSYCEFPDDGSSTYYYSLYLLISNQLIIMNVLKYLQVKINFTCY